MFLSGDGSIDFLEFLEVMANKMGEHTFEDDLRDAFQLFDTDCNGYISKRELTFVLTSLGEQITDAAVENMIKEVDLDGDGRVNYEGKKKRLDKGDVIVVLTLREASEIQ